MTEIAKTEPLWRRAVWLYVDGFKSMTVGRKLWALILIKLFIFFAVLKLFFFPDLLSTNYDTDAERADAVRQALTAPDNDANYLKPISNYE